MKLVYFILSLFCSLALHAQVQLSGQVKTERWSVKDIEVLNLVTEEVVRTNENGEFSIPVSEGDMLVIAHPNFQYYRKSITAAVLQSPVLQIQLTLREQVEILDEVIVNNTTISAEQLGIKAKPKLTRAQSQFVTGGRIVNEMYLGTFGGVVLNLDAIINAINGRRQFLKQALVLEEHELNYAKLRKQFSDEQLKSQFQLTDDQVDDFLYFASMQEATKTHLETSNLTALQLYLSEIVQEYHERQQATALD